MSLKKGDKNISILINTLPLLGEKNINKNGTYVAKGDKLDGYSKVVVDVPQEGTTKNSYKRATVEEMNNITDMKDGDNCLVLSEELRPMVVQDEPQTLYFPNEVILETPFTEWAQMTLRGEKTGNRIDVLFGGGQFDLQTDLNGTPVQIRYRSDDELKYTRRGEKEKIDFGEKILCERPEEFKKEMGYFMLVDGTIFNGVYQYNSDTWSYQNVNSEATAEDVFEGQIAYTNNGLVKGILGNSKNISTSLNDKNALVYARTQNIYNEITPTILTDTNKTIPDDIVCIPMDSNGIPLYDTSAITKFESFLSGKKSLVNICKIDTSNGTNMSRMFNNCSLLANVPKFETSKCTNMEGMFNGCSNITSVPLFNTSLVTDMSNMFNGCSSLKSVEKLDMSSVTSVSSMFTGCTNLQAIPLFNTNNVENMNNFFLNCKSLKEIPILPTGKVTNMSQMCMNCSSLTKLPKLDTASVTTLNRTFLGAGFEEVDATDLDLTGVSDVRYLFAQCPNLKTVRNLDLSGLGTEIVNAEKRMDYLFSSCIELINLENINTTGIIYMQNTFSSCQSLKVIPLMDTSSVTNMSSCFYYCTGIKEFPALNTSKVTSFSYTFAYCMGLQTIPEMDFSSAIYISNTFEFCKQLENVGGFINLGNNYMTDDMANHPVRTLTLSDSEKLTEQSMINILNGLFNIAGKGVKVQKVVLGTTNLAKLTSAEGQAALTNATQKGWTVS